MVRVGAQVSSLQMRMISRLSALNSEMVRNNVRLSTGKRINSAADDPSGTVAVAKLRAELTSVQQAFENNSTTSNLVNTADSALSQVVAHLQTIRSKALEAVGGGLSRSQLAANQTEIDAAIAAINQTARTTEFNGKRLLDGSKDFTVTGSNASQVDRVVVLDRNTSQASQTIDVDVTTAAAQAQLSYAGQGNKVKDDATITLTGSAGTASIKAIDKEDLTDLRDRINNETTTTGVAASVSGNSLTLSSTGYGSSAAVSVQVTSGQFDVTGGNGNGTANGTDAEATFNGKSYTADGLKFRLRSNTLDADLDLDSSFGTGTIDTITVSGNALSFQLGANIGRASVLSLQGVQDYQLGGSSGRLDEVRTGGGKSLFDDPAAVVNIIDEALSQVTFEQARVGAFSKYTIDSSAESLGSQEINLTEAISAIEDADLVLETSLLLQNQILASSTTAALGIASNLNASFLPLLQSIAY